MLYRVTLTVFCLATFAASALGADLVDDFASPSVIGSGSGGAYLPGANWSVSHGLARLDPAGALGSGLGVLYLGDSAGVGPAGGAPASLLSVASFGSAEYFYRGGRHARLVFGYQDANNYFFAEVRSALRTVGTSSGTFSFAIGKVAAGAVTYLGQAGTFQTGTDQAVYEITAVWDVSANTVAGWVKRIDRLGSKDYVTAIATIAAVSDGNVRESGKFGAVEPTLTVRPIDRLSCTANTSGTGDVYDLNRGYKLAKGTKTGFYHLQKFDNRWLWVSPYGNIFIPIGASIVGRQPDSWNGSEKGLISHRDYCITKYGDLAKWQTASEARFKAWGLNYTGYYTLESLTSKNLPTCKTCNLTVGAIDDRWDVAGNVWWGVDTTNYDGFLCPDFFNPAVATYAANQIRSSVPNVNDPLILGLYADEPDNLKGFSSTHPHMGLALLMGKTTIGVGGKSTPAIYTNYSKKATTDFLKARYGTITALNASWGMSYASWSTLDSITYSSATYGSWSNPVRSAYPNYRRDLDDIGVMFFTQYGNVVKTAVRGYDTHHALGQHLYGAAVAEGGIGVNPMLAKGLKASDAFDFYVCDFGTESYDQVGKPFLNVQYLTAEDDSPLRFSGTIDSYRSETYSGTQYLRIHKDGVDFWFGNNGSTSYNLFGHINGLSLPGKKNAGGARMRYCGNETGGGWFYYQPTDPPNTGTVNEWITALNALAAQGKKATYKRESTYNIYGYDTQEQRAAAWVASVNDIVNVKSAATGEYFKAGIEIWKWMDNGWNYWLEQRNFGLVTIKDNAYDAVEATILGADGLAGTWDDQLDDYGDFVTPFKTANLGLYDRIIVQSVPTFTVSVTPNKTWMYENDGTRTGGRHTVTFTAAVSGNTSGLTSYSYQWTAPVHPATGKALALVSGGTSTSPTATYAAPELPACGKTLYEVSCRVTGSAGANQTAFGEGSGNIKVRVLCDANGDDAATITDMSVWKLQSGQVGQNLSADFNGDGTVTITDMALWKLNSGRICP